MRNFLNALAAILLLAVLAPAPAARAQTAESMETVQLGGGYQMMVSCEGTRIRLRRVGQGELMVSCTKRAVRAVPVSATDDELRLDPGESTTLYCHGDALKAKRKTGAQLSANCKPIPVPAI